MRDERIKVEIWGQGACEICLGTGKVYRVVLGDVEKRMCEKCMRELEGKLEERLEEEWRKYWRADA